MISKEKYDLINTKCERNYPGICNYNLRYAADEIVHTIYKELLEIIYIIFDYPYKHYTFNHFKV